jgi:superfamily II DNA or RNA helicase
MTRDEHLQAILSMADKPLLLQIGTGIGKTRIALELLKKWDAKKIFILVPLHSIMLSWKEEMKKWKFDTKGKTIEIQCYASIHKFAETKWDAVICDEGHHITERCQEFFETIEFDHFVALSATVPKAAKQRIRDIVPNIVEYRISARKAIDDNILPDPKVVLIKLFLNTKNNTECIVLNKGKGKPITVDWDNRKSYINAKYPEIRINCTEWQYYNYVTAKIDTLKRQYFRSKKDFLKNLWLQKAGERLKWLARHKNRHVNWLMANTFKDMRTLIFCSDVEQTEQLCPNAINSKDSDTSMDILAKFNEGKINQIAACQMLNEGVNLVNCKLGMFAALNSSEILQKQKLGRLLRHKEPVIVIPYFVATREEEIIEKMKQDYNPELIQVVTSPKDIKL